jgi:hypothetical protein
MPCTARWTIRKLSSGRALNAVSVARISFEPEMMFPMVWTSCLLTGQLRECHGVQIEEVGGGASLAVLPAAVPE